MLKTVFVYIYVRTYVRIYISGVVNLSRRFVKLYYLLDSDFRQSLLTRHQDDDGLFCDQQFLSTRTDGNTKHSGCCACEK